ncbi:MAG: hypothetical protein AB7V04_00920 [Desulfomonilaceae bacterium]
MEALERPMAGIDPLEIAISNLSDNELGLLSEYRELYLAGFTVEEIRGMMGSESFEMALDVMRGVDSEIARLSVPPVRKMVPRPKIRAAINGKIGGSERRSAGIDYDDC